MGESQNKYTEWKESGSNMNILYDSFKIKF